MLLHGVQTQGVRAKLRDNYITFFTVSYSLDQETWSTYRGNNTRQNNVCPPPWCTHTVYLLLSRVRVTI